MTENASLEKTGNEDHPDQSSFAIAETRRNDPFPPGLVGDIAAFLYECAPRPVHDFAIVGALGLVSAIQGRAHSINGSGLNLYLMPVAPAGTGKSAIAIGINQLMNAVSDVYDYDNDPVHKKFRILDFIGPSTMESGPALHRYLLEDSKSFLSVFSSGNTPLNPRNLLDANDSRNNLRGVILDLFDKSGPDQVLHTFPHTSHDENNFVRKSIIRPTFSMVCQFTPQQFHEALSQDINGFDLMSRCITIEYTGPRVAANRTHHLMEPKEKLVEDLGGLITNSGYINRRDDNIRIQLDSDAERLMNAFDIECDKHINNALQNSTECNAESENNLSPENRLRIWNHAYLKALRIAGVVACGKGYVDNAPLVTEEMACWSINFIKSDIEAMSRHFSVIKNKSA